MVALSERLEGTEQAKGPSELVMCRPGLAQKPGLGLGFGGLRLTKPGARPIVKAQAWLGLGWAQAQALVEKQFKFTR